MLQKKRQEYQTGLRRHQLEKLFKERRQEIRLGESFANEEDNHQVKELRQIIDTVRQCLSSRNYQFASNGLSQLLQRVENYHQTRIGLLSLCNILCKLLKQMIVNEQTQQKNEWAKIPQQLQKQFLFLLLRIIATMNCESAEASQIKLVYPTIKMLFDNTFLKEDAEEGWVLTEVSLIIILWLYSTRLQDIFRQISNCSIGSDLVVLIGYSPNMGATQHSLLIQVVELYLNQQCFYAQQNANPHKDQDIPIIGMDSIEKQHLLGYSLSLIHHRKQQLYVSAFNCIMSVLFLHEYLAESFEDHSLREICQLMFHPSRQIRAGAISVLNDVIYFSVLVTNELLKSTNIVDAIEQLLTIECQGQDKYTSVNINHLSCILTNLCFTKDRELKNCLADHNIWTVLYNNLNPSSRLFPMAIAFDAYFEMIGRNKCLSILPSFLCALGQIDFSLIQKREGDSLKNAVVRIFLKAKDYWQEKDLETFIGLIRSYRLDFLLEDIIDQLDLEEYSSVP